MNYSHIQLTISLQMLMKADGIRVNDCSRAIDIYYSKSNYQYIILFFLFKK